MFITEVKIKGFGKIKDFNHPFSADLNVICEENGCGKSTLAEYVKAMFYGFENADQMEHFRPWYSEQYGGELTFKYGWKTYRIVRDWNMDSGDLSGNLKIYDVKKSKETTDFTSDLGFDVFGVDRESFSKTAFFAQSDIQTCITDDIGMKAGRTPEELIGLEKHNKEISDATAEMESLKNNENTGKIQVLSVKIVKLNQSVSQKPSIDSRLEDNQKKLKVVDERLNTENEQKSKLNQRITDVSNLQKIESEQTKYDAQLNKVNSAADKAKKIGGYFPKSVPTKTDINAAILANSSLVKASETINENAFSDYEKEHAKPLFLFFENKDVPSSETINRHMNKVKQFKKDTADDAKALTEREINDLNHLTEKFNFIEKDEEVDTEITDTIKKINSIDRLETNLAQEKIKMNAAKQSLDDSKGSISVLGIILLITGLVLCGIGAVIIFNLIYGIYIELTVGYACAIAGAVAVVIGIVLMIVRMSKNGKKRNELSDKVAETEKNVQKASELLDSEKKAVDEFLNKIRVKNDMNVIDNLYAMKNDWKTFNELFKKNYEWELHNNHGPVQNLDNTTTFLGNYFNEYEMQADYEKLLINLDKKATEYRIYFTKASRLEEAQQTETKYANKIIEFFDKYEIQRTKDIAKQLDEIKINERLYENAELEYGREKDALEKLKNYSDEIVTLKKKVGNDTLESLTSELDKCNTAILSMTRERDGIQSQINNLKDIIVKISTAQDQIKQLKNEKHNLEVRYNTLKNNIEVAKTEKEKILNSYVAPVSKAFDKYYKMLSGNAEQQYKLDENLNIHLYESDKKRSLDALSAGNQDLVSLCRRIALLDAMYKDEKPVLVMDDPFVNLDDKRLKNTMEFLKEISKKYQIIYFTCRSLRN